MDRVELDPYFTFNSDFRTQRGYFFQPELVPPALRVTSMAVGKVLNKGQNWGSCFVVGEGGRQYLISAAHCFREGNMQDGFGPIEAREIVFPNDRRLNLGEENVVPLPETPLALDVIVFGLSGEVTETPLKLARQRRLHSGEKSFVIGYPYACLEAQRQIGPMFSVGQLISPSALDYYLIRTNIRTEHGCSGGPLLTSEGVMGVIIAIPDPTSKKAQLLAQLTEASVYRQRARSFALSLPAILAAGLEL